MRPNNLKPYIFCIYKHIGEVKCQTYQVRLQKDDNFEAKQSKNKKTKTLHFIYKHIAVLKCETYLVQLQMADNFFKKKRSKTLPLYMNTYKESIAQQVQLEPKPIKVPTSKGRQHRHRPKQPRKNKPSKTLHYRLLTHIRVQMPNLSSSTQI